MDSSKDTPTPAPSADAPLTEENMHDNQNNIVGTVDSDNSNVQHDQNVISQPTQVADDQQYQTDPFTVKANKVAPIYLQ